MSETTACIIRVFLASPGDVPEERAQARYLIKDDLPTLPFIKDRTWLKIVAWEDPTSRAPMPATLSPQKAIELGMDRPASCDIVVVVFWSRMGTPLDEERHGLKDGARPYWSGTEWEYEDALQASEVTGKPVVLVYRRTANVPLNPTWHDFDERVTQLKRVEEFFAAFRDPNTGAFLRGFTEYETPEQFGEMLKHDLLHYIQQLLDEEPATGDEAEVVPTPPAWAGSPFPGLRAFTPEDAPIFFGRNRETDALLKRVSEQRVVAVVGASGSGKSSLVGAGLIPRLLDNAIPGSKDWKIARFSPGELGDNPFMPLAVALKLALPRVQIPGLVAKLWSNPDTVLAVVDQALEGEPEWTQVLLFIDQFEELFTLAKQDRRQSLFIHMLNTIAQSERVRAVITLRADFYHRCVEHEAMAELLRAGSFPLAAPGERALYEMITRPAERAGLNYEDGDLPERILADTGQEPGALALLAYTLDELYQDCSEGGGQMLSHAAYEALGGVQGAIGQRAESVFTQLNPAAQAALSRVFRELVEVDERGTATRQRAPLARFAGHDAARALLERFTDARLLVTSGNGAEAVIEVAHEALFRHWERLAAWIDDMQSDLFLLRQVRQAADLWASQDYHDDFLWTGQRLKDAQAMVARLDPGLDETERNFLRSEVERLEKRLTDLNLRHPERSWIGERLHIIGDTRPGVGLRADGLPDIVWCAVPGGEVEIEGQTFAVKPFYIAQYAITYRQCQAFIDAGDGWQNARWWEGLAAGDNDKQAPGEQQFKFDNHPRERVSWYDAVAFCRWLTARLPPDGWPPAAFETRDKWEIRLPTEWEWQQAATGGSTAHVFPWGADEEGGQHGNTRKSGLLRTTAVGMYPQGASPVGALDMSGNVFEWCLNEHENLENTGLAGAAARVLRGGSWYDNAHYARCAYRDGDNPGLRGDLNGFRVCCALYSGL